MGGPRKVAVLDESVGVRARSLTLMYPPPPALSRAPGPSRPFFLPFRTRKRACQVLLTLSGQCVLEKNAPAPAFHHLGRQVHSRRILLNQFQNTCLLQPGPSSVMAHAGRHRPKGRTTSVQLGKRREVSTRTGVERLLPGQETARVPVPQAIPTTQHLRCCRHRGALVSWISAAPGRK